MPAFGADNNPHYAIRITDGPPPNRQGTKRSFGDTRSNLTPLQFADKVRPVPWII